MLTEKQIQGKRNRQAGARFERKVRDDLEKKGLIIDKWGNNVEDNKLIKAKSNRFNMRSMGFPDFIGFRRVGQLYTIAGIECKSNGYLDKIEKEKCEWYLKNKIFYTILIASKGKKRGEIKYAEFKIRN